MTARAPRSSPGSGDERLTGSATAAVLFGVVIVVTHGFGNSLVPALLPRIAESLDAGYGVLGLAVATGLIAYGVGAALGIRIVDRVPPRALLATCLAVCSAGLLAVSGAGSPGVLALCVVVIGLASPISWSVTVYFVGRVVGSAAHGRVLAVAAAGAGVGNGINGVFVQLLTARGQWRWAFVIAGGLAAAMVVVTLLVLRRPIEPPARAAGTGREGEAWRRIWSEPAGRLVILLSMVAGIGTFTFSAYLSEVALDEMLVSPLAAATPWWLASAVGIAVALPIGLISDRGSPVGVMAITALTYGASLTILVFTWSYPALLMATFGFAVFSYPIWGLFGLVAHRSFPPELAVRAVSGGLAVAACSAMAGVTAAGWWIDRTGSLRGPAIVLAVMITAVGVRLLCLHRAQSPRASRGEQRPPTVSSEQVRRKTMSISLEDCEQPGSSTILRDLPGPTDG